MELIKEIGSRTSVSKAGKTSTRKWGLFECPSCHTQKEYNLQKGYKNKTCGAPGCRKTAAVFNPWNAGMTEEDRINALPYYSTFSSYFQTLRGKELSLSWNSLKEFREDMYDSYKLARDVNKRITLLVINDKPLSSNNCKWVQIGMTTIHTDEEIIDDNYHSALLPAELLIPKEDLDKLIRNEYPDKLRTVVYGRDGSTIANPNLYYTFTEKEYKHIRQKVRDLQLIKSDNYLYLIRMKGTDFVKIGKTTNVQNRLDDFNVGNPYELEVLFSTKMFNYGKLEQRTHKYVKKYKIKGEWFKLDSNKIDNTIQFITDMINNP